MSPPTSPTTPLSTRSLNTTSPTKPPSEKPTEADKPKTMEYHRQVLQSKLEGDG